MSVELETGNRNWRKWLYPTVLILVLLLGIVLRLKGFLANPSLWHDECALAWNIKFKSYPELFGHLRFLQVAPPFFMVLTKFLVNLFHVQNNVSGFDLTVRLIPFLCGTLSLGVFYFLSKEVLQTKKAVLVSLFLFSINTILINYSFEFKPYSSDMFFILLLFLFFVKLNLSEIGYKKLALASFAIAVSIWFSFVSAFVIGASFFVLISKRKEFKKILLLYSPILVSVLLYLKLYLLGTYHDNNKGMIGFWGNEFVLANLSNFFYLFVENIRYFFSPAKCVLFVLILLIYGIFIYYKEKRYDFINLVLLAFSFLVIASIFHIYPFSKRLILFLIPIFIILITKPFDTISFSHKIKSFFVLVMMFFILIPQVVFVFQTLPKKINKGEFPREMMEYMAKNIKPSDNIFINKASNTEFYYYSSFYNIKNNVFYEMVGNSPDKKYLGYLNSLPKGNCWLFLAYDYYPQLTMINYTIKWAQSNTKLITESKSTQSALLYVSID